MSTCGTCSVICVCSRVFPDKDALILGAVELGSLISTKSPVAVQGSKINLVYSRDHSVADGLEYVVGIYKIGSQYFYYISITCFEVTFCGCTSTTSCCVQLEHHAFMKPAPEKTSHTFYLACSVG